MYLKIHTYTLAPLPLPQPFLKYHYQYSVLLKLHLPLSEPQPAMSLDTFSIVFFLIGGAVVGGLQLLRSRLEEPAEG